MLRVPLLQPLTALLCIFLTAANGWSQINIPNSTPVTQNFNGIGTSATASLPANWKMSAVGAGNTVNWTDAGNVITTTAAAQSGTPTAGGRYNWGASTTDRAIGFMTDASYSSPNSIMAFYRNTTGATISKLGIGFNIERYRTNTGTFSLSFFISTDGTNWTSLPDGDIATTVFATGTSAYSFGSPLSVTKTIIANVSIPNNGDLYLRWAFITDNSNSQGIGLDNVSISALTSPAINPNLPITCPYDIIFVLDESASIVGQGGNNAADIPCRPSGESRRSLIALFSSTPAG